MRIEKGVKIVEKEDKELIVNPNEHFVKGSADGGWIVHQALRESPFKIRAITIDDNPEIAIKIAKLLNEDLAK